MRFLSSPGLPETAVCRILAAESACSTLREPLETLGIQVIPAPKTLSLPYRMNDRADMNCRMLGGREVIVFQDAVLPEGFHAAGLSVTRSRAKGGDKYPADAALNALLVSGFAFHKVGATDLTLAKLLEDRSYLTLDVPQGYTADSAIVVDDSSLMTTDDKLALIAEDAGFSVLRISPGQIKAPGYDFGFLGGCSCKIGPDRMAFTGTPDGIAERDEILAFLEERGITPVYLTDRPCFDCGGLIPVAQL